MSDSSKAVFLSYASQDADAARRIAEALRAAGVEVWFDQSELVGGDSWDQKIRGQIKACALFVPMISAESQARREGYFRLEWKLAAQRTHTIADGTPFLLPVVIDATRDPEALVPEEFRSVQWTRLAGGEATTAFVARVKTLLGIEVAPVPQARDRRIETPQTTDAGRRPALPRGRMPLGWTIGIAAVIALSVIGWIVAHRSANSSSGPDSAAGRNAPPTAGISSTPLNDKSIAVLPFENLSDDKDNTAFFSDGMQEDILTSLANIPELRVVSRTSVMQYRDTKKPIPQIARELGVAYILEGSVRRAGNQVRITGQLIRAANDEHLWARRYDRELTPREIFAIQAALSTEIAGALKAAISPETKKLLDRRPTENLAAYELYLKARSSNMGTGFGRVRLARNERDLEAAVDLDPNFAEAWAELAMCHAAYVLQEYDHTSARLTQADAAVNRAVRLAPETPAVIFALGHTFWARGDYVHATAQFEKVLAAHPANAEAYFWLSTVQIWQGRWREAMANLRQAVELDQGNILYSAQLAVGLRFYRRSEEALDIQRRVIALVPDDIQQRILLADVAFQASGSMREAEDLLTRLTPAQLESRPVNALRRTIANARGDYAEWKRLYAMAPAVETGGEPGWGILNPAITMVANGDLNAAHVLLDDVMVKLKSEIARQPDNARYLSRLAQMEALLGQKEAALRDAHKAVEIKPESADAVIGPQMSRGLAMVYAWTGDKEHAIAELSRLLRIPGGMDGVHSLRVDPAFAPLRGDPRFEALLNDPKNNEPLF